MKRFQDKTVVITGGNSGIGRAAAERFRDEGARVVIVGRNEAKVGQAAEELGVEGLVADVADNAALDAAFTSLKKKYGRVDVLFANAGVVEFAPISDVTSEHYERQTNINQRGLLFTIQRALPLLKEGSTVVVNTSVVNVVGMENTSVYSATKAAARSYVRTLARELAPRGIRVNAVSPGPIETPIFGKSGLPGEAIEAFASEIVPQVPLKRFGKASEIAAAAAFLASDEAAYITGAELPVDGGMTQV